jgi:winged helix domain-containing protein
LACRLEATALTLALKEREKLRKILDLSDRLGELRRRVREDGSTIPVKDLGEEVREIAGRIVTIGLPGALGELGQAHRLSPQEMVILLLLLNRRIEGESTLTGREILSTLFPSSYGILSGAALLRADSPLRSSGAVVICPAEAADLLEASFGVSDDLFRAVEKDAHPRGEPSEGTRPYGNHQEHLADLARLSGLLLQRASAVFDIDPYPIRLFESAISPTHVDRQASSLRARIAERLRTTPEAEDFPISRLTRRLRLSEDEELILVALLAQECFSGAGGLDAVDCVKMVSRTPEEVLRKRSLLSPSATLRREGIVEARDPGEGADLSNGVYIAEWVVSFLLGEEEDEEAGPIGPDTRLEFHEYLEQLDDSGRFFDDLT